MDDRARACTGCAACEAGSGAEMTFAAVRKGDLAVEDLVFADDAQAAPPRARAAGIGAQCDPVQSDRRLHFERLGRQVHAVSRVGLDHVDTVAIGAAAATAGDQLADDETLSTAT